MHLGSDAATSAESGVPDAARAQGMAQRSFASSHGGKLPSSASNPCRLFVTPAIRVRFAVSSPRVRERTRSRRPRRQLTIGRDKTRNNRLFFSSCGDRVASESRLTDIRQTVRIISPVRTALDFRSVLTVSRSSTSTRRWRPASWLFHVLVPEKAPGIRHPAGLFFQTPSGSAADPRPQGIAVKGPGAFRPARDIVNATS